MYIVATTNDGCWTTATMSRVVILRFFDTPKTSRLEVLVLVKVITAGNQLQSWKVFSFLHVLSGF